MATPHSERCETPRPNQTSTEHPRSIAPAALAEALLEELPALRHKLRKALPSASPLDAMEEVLKFLYLIGYFQKPLTPSLEVDLAWHEFILCTRAYMGFCQRHFGRYIHHSPGGEEAENQRQFRKTLSLYILCYGPLRPGFWPAHESTGCGSCLADN